MTLRVADLFAGAGGASTGVMLASAQLGLDVDLVAINHWPAAVETHAVNHPEARHLCMAVDQVDPRRAVPGGKLDLLVAGPECTHHSVARGGKPVNDQSRCSPWVLLRWVDVLQVEHVIVENVVELRSWGPIGRNNRPIKAKRGESYRAWIGAWRAADYTVDERVLVAADYGEATTRARLFIQMKKNRRGRKTEIVWPEPSHAPAGTASLLRQTDAWRPARDIINWSIPSQSIFGRKRPLADTTIKRIIAGLERFGGKAFILPHRMFDGMQVDDIERPLRTFTASNGGCVGVVEPFVIPIDHTSSGGPRSVADPLSTITTKARHAVVEAFTMPYNSNGGRLARRVSEPLGTITTRDRFALVQPVGGDIRLRMLQPAELAAAMGFPEGYQFLGTKSDAIRMIGNAWSVRTAEALCRVILEQVTPARRRDAVARADVA